MNTLSERISSLSEEQKDELRARLKEARQRVGKQGATLSDLFTRWADKCPDRVAVSSKDTQVSYGKLAQLSAGLAGLLKERGIGRGHLVGLCVPRSVETIVSLLGIAGAGAAYVPLDPSFPRERLAFMAADSGISVILASREAAEVLPESGAEILVLEEVWADLAAAATKPAAASLAGPDDLAYIMYTSGSTGRPKGVAITNRGFPGLVGYLYEAFGHATPRRILQHTSMNFDISVLECISALLCGSTLVLANRDMKAIGADLAAILVEQAIEIILITPTALATLPEKSLPSLRYIAVGGESCPIDLAHAWSPGRFFFNGYGPTEATIFVCIAQYGANLDRIHIGKPVAGARLLVLDSRMQVVPAGVAGELYIGGPGLARGYVNRPGLTAETFIADPYADDGRRLYRTGDRVRLLPSGDLEWLGRIDQQVKIRGFRIELGEIEQVLEQHPGVRQAVVLVSEDGPAKRLVTFVVLHELIAEEQLKEFVGKRLPGYMVPSIVVPVEALPLGATGKADREALAKMIPNGGEEKYVKARTAVEEKLALVWGEVLGLGRPAGIFDDFFALGGDSILSLQVVFRARQEGVHVTVKQLFDHPIIADLALLAEVADITAVQAEQGLVTGPVELTPVQQWFFSRGLPNPDYFNQSAVVEVPAGIATSDWQRIIRCLLEHHDGLRSRFVNQDGNWSAEITGMPTEIPLKVIAAGADADRQAQLLEQIGQEVQAGFQLDSTPLFQTVLFTGWNVKESRLLIVAHHLVVDVVSWRILLEDLASLVAALQQGKPLMLPEKTTSWQQWAAHMSAEALSPRTASEIAFWNTQTLPPERSLPVDARPRANKADCYAIYDGALSEAETRALLQDIPAAFGTQINDVLLTAVAAALGAWSGAVRVRLDLEGHGREPLFDDADVSRTVGWFTTISPLMVPVASPDSPAAGLKEVKELMRSRPRNGIGYGLLYGDGGGTGRQAAQVSFNYLGQFDDVGGRFVSGMGMAGPDVDPRNERPYLIDIVGQIAFGQLHLKWDYNQEAFKPETIAQVAEGAMTVLRDLAAASRDSLIHGYTPSDFPASGMSQEGIDGMIARMLHLPVWQNRKTPRPLLDCYPQTPVQQGLWFQSRLAGGEGVYHVQSVFQIDHDLDTGMLRRAWVEVMRRHPSLRTSFCEDEKGNAYQLVWDLSEPPMEEQDWSSRKDYQKDIETYLENDRARGFGPGDIPQWRILLVKTAPAAYQMIWSSHHGIIDGWSIGLLFNDLANTYDILSHGAKHPVTPAPRPYRDYVAWLGTQDLEQSERFWRSYLQDFEQPTPLPKVGRGPDISALTANPMVHLTRRIPAGLYTAMQEFAKAEALTLNTLLQGAWAVLLGRYGKAEEVVFGTVVSGRTSEVTGIENMVGLFINTLPLRVRLPDHQGVSDWLHQLQDDSFEIRQYEHTPLSLIQGFGQIPSKVPLFHSLFVFENYPVEKADGALEFRQTDAHEQTHYPLSLIVTAAGSLQLDIMFDARQIDGDTVERLFAGLEVICRHFVTFPENPLGCVTPLSENEYKLAIDRFSTESTAEVSEPFLHELLAKAAELWPDGIALVCGDEQLSYAELNRRTNQLGHWLKSHGVGPDVLVGLYLDRSVESIIGLMGILKAGGAYVPLDSSYPKKRLAWIIQDASLEMMLTQKHLCRSLPDELQKLCLDSEWEQVGKQPERMPQAGITGDNLAYIIYTSGSTGAPKGVMVAHHCFRHVLPWLRSQPGLSRPRRVLQVASLGFDFSVWEILLPLATGGVLHLPNRGERMIGSELAAKIRESGIESLNFTPGNLATLENKELKSLNSLLVGGEAYSAELIREWAPGRMYQNVYGPTETTIFATAAPLDEGLENIHMGRPITNVRIYVLDAAMRPVPLGCEGELYIGGAGLTRGYLNRPDLTAQRYVADPFGPEPGARLYKSGDVVRFTADGNLEFVGRTDDQVKIRGFRMELGEIQTKLNEHPLVTNSVVVVREGDAGKYLAAYVAANEETVTSGMLEQFLYTQLPPYMVPRTYVLMESLPLNSSGKVNRGELPEPGIKAGPDGSAPPQTLTEACLIAIWKEVLGQPLIGSHDDFFILGGHSLLAVQVVTRIQRELGVDCPLRLLFDYPTVAGLAAQIDMLPRTAKSAAMVPLERVSRKEPLPATANQQRLWFMEHLHPGSSLYTVGWFQYWQLRLDLKVLRTALNRLSIRHEPLRTAFCHDGEGLYQVIASKPAYELDECDLSQMSGDVLPLEVANCAHGLWQKPFDLAAGPLLRLLLVRLPANETVLVVSVHHAIIDGFSIPIFDSELRAFYDDVLTGATGPSPLQIQFADYAVWQRQQLEDGRADEHLKYFADQLAGAPELISLPTDRLRPAVQDYRGANTQIRLEHELTVLLDETAVSLHTTRFVLFLSGVAIVLSRYSGQEQVVIGIPIANRNRSETEPMIGFLVNTIALCIDLSDGPSFASVVAQVQSKLLESYHHQHVPFERVVDYLKPERSLSYSPVFQVLVTGLDQLSDSMANGPEWLDEITDSGIGMSKFDLSLTLTPNRKEVRLACEYATSLFDEGSVIRMGRHMLTCLQTAMTNPDLPVNRLPLLTTGEQEGITVSRNRTDDGTIMNDSCLHELFARQVQATPDGIAISYKESQMTYRHMDALVGRIASALRELGAAADVCVGICMFRSLDLVIGLHAIHRAGAAYVPLDPEIPGERLSYIADDAKITLVLARPDTAGLLAGLESCCILVVEDGCIIRIDGEKKNPTLQTAVPQTLPDNLAYIIYTSGSTGKPKGVMLSHRGVVNRLLWMQQAYPLGPGDHALQKTPFGFDVSVWEFFWPLLVGARLHIAAADGHKDPDYLARLLKEQEIKIVHFVPSMLQQFLKFPGVGPRAAGLQHIVCSGEALSLEVQNEAFRLLPNTRLHNLYGPTEASVDVSFWECRIEPGALSVPIGTPVANTQLYILDAAMSPVPDGVAGELYIGGIQLARGYLGQPALTAERFVANPFHAGRLYATGDLARFRGDGVIEYIGRTDYQVKIRGLRIEIGEIEAVLEEYPAIMMCVVVVHELSAFDQRLTAFLTAKEGFLIHTEEVRQFLQKRLPEYMVPAYFMVLDEMPLNANGKIDRKALPAITEMLNSNQSDEYYAAPQGELETDLTELWEELLGLKRIGVEDDFFRLGGHSLLVARMAVAVQERWGYELELATVFQNRTIKTLAAAIAVTADQDNTALMEADELWDLI